MPLWHRRASIQARNSGFSRSTATIRTPWPSCAPIFEDKVVDFLCGQVKITDKAESEDLFKDPDELAKVLKAN